jgi:1-acyl-sn-glycerol-3-phosphate acyltransferase
MEQQLDKVKALTHQLIDEVCLALGLSPTAWYRKLISPVVWRPTNLFARMAAGFDEIVGRSGIREATHWLLPRFVKGIEVQGVENIPSQGPLLIAANHPGAYDGLTIIANLPRDDVRIVSSQIPFITSLPFLSHHMVFTPHPEKTHDRMATVRAMIRRLRDGDALLIFPSGGIDPDPAVLPGAVEALESWSRSLQIALRRVPQTQVLLAIVSGVLSPKYTEHPLTRVREGIRNRIRIAEFLQVIQQIRLPQRLLLSPKVTFDRPLAAEELREGGDDKIMPRIIDRAKQLLTRHMASVLTQPG